MTAFLFSTFNALTRGQVEFPELMAAPPSVWLWVTSLGLMDGLRPDTGRRVGGRMQVQVTLSIKDPTLANLPTAETYLQPQISGQGASEVAQRHTWSRKCSESPRGLSPAQDTQGTRRGSVFSFLLTL